VKAKEITIGMSIVEDGIAYKVTLIYRGGRGTYAFNTELGVFIYRGNQIVAVA
jgi:hypothetical protein